MLFHSWIFAAFFAIALTGHLLLRRTAMSTLWLLLCSYVFYGWWNPLLLLLILTSTAIDFGVVARMARSDHKRGWLAVSIATNLGLLGFFKYAGFVTDNLNLLLAATGYQLPAPDIVLPVGISFFTFQSMSYTIDVYRGAMKPEPSFIRFAAFVSLFPQLVAGPIERARNLLPQLTTPSRITARDFADGASMFLIGLFKKVALADYLSLYVDAVYDAPQQHEAPALILATIAFGWQIFFDFSGYTDMARGIARTMGFRLMLNFDNPYAATDLGDFWRRWHISLSTWFRDYVYKPIGGNRFGSNRTMINIAATMLLSGLWHGAAWGFVLWGALHALGRMATLPLERTSFYRERLPRFAKQLWVFCFVMFAWVFFRAQTWDMSSLVIGRMVTTGWSDPQMPWLMLVIVTAAWCWQLTCAADGPVRRALYNPVTRVLFALFMILWLLLVATPATKPFLYFQF